MDVYSIAEKILERIPTGLSKLEQARFVYIELGKLVSFDEEYKLGNSETKKALRKSAYKIKEFEHFKNMKDNKIICISLTKLYNILMGKIGIKATEVKEDYDVHMYSELYIDGEYYEADLVDDLKCIQTRRKTKGFKCISNSIEDKKLEEIDIKIGYSYEGEKDFNDMLKEIRENVKSIKEIDKKVEEILKTIGEYKDVSKMAYTEKMNDYEYIINRVLTEEERKKLHYNHLYREKAGKRKYTCCISVQRKNGSYYRRIYSEKDGDFLLIDDEKIIELMENGLRACQNNKIPGLKKTIKELKKKNNEFNR